MFDKILPTAIFIVSVSLGILVWNSFDDSKSIFIKQSEKLNSKTSYEIYISEINWRGLSNAGSVAIAIFDENRNFYLCECTVSYELKNGKDQYRIIKREVEAGYWRLRNNTSLEAISIKYPHRGLGENSGVYPYGKPPSSKTIWKKRYGGDIQRNFLNRSKIELPDEIVETLGWYLPKKFARAKTKIIGIEKIIGN